MPAERNPDTSARGAAARLLALAAETLDRRGADALGAALRRGCWIYGAGGYGRTVRDLLVDRGIQPRGFIDRRAPDPALDAALGLPTIAPGTVAESQVRGATLIVALHNFATEQRPVVEWARAAGFAEVIVPAELPDLLGTGAGSYWLTGRRFTADAADRVEAAAALLADPRSVEVLLGAARYRVSGEAGDHPTSHLPSQYFPPDVPLTAEPLRAVDGGAYIGDIHDVASRSGLRFAEWWAFEPDPANFVKLVECAAQVRVPRTTLFPCGLGDGCAQIRFSSGAADGSRIGEGDQVAQVVALDQVLPGIEPNYVKLDIEGFEREAIAGMEQTLRRAKPQIAMSIYHKPQDLWELPALIHDLLPHHRLYVRQHGYNGFDTVLYAVPLATSQ